MQQKSHTFKSSMNIIGWAILAIATFAGLYLISAYLLSRISISAEPGADHDVAIYIFTNGAHTDIVVPVKNDDIDWSREIKFSNTIANDPTATLVGIGWGDKGFYLDTPTWAQLKFSVAFKAGTALSTAAMHATFYHSLTEGPDCKKILISHEQYARLIAYIQDSFKKDQRGGYIVIPTTAHYNHNDAFYEARRRYSIFYTCNTWANNALKAAGQKACLWTPFDKGIFYQYR